MTMEQSHVQTYGIDTAVFCKTREFVTEPPEQLTATVCANRH